MTKPHKGGGRFKRLLATASLGAMAVWGASTPAEALPVRDDVGVNGAVDVDNEFAGVGQMFNRRLNANGTVSTFLCTGQLINPRTVVFAQHCTGGVSDFGYGPGLGNHMAFGFNPTDAFTGFDLWRRGGVAGGAVQNPITGVWESLPDQDLYNVLQLQSVFNVTEPFPGGDISMATLDSPVNNLPSYGMLFSPLSGPEHARLVGYGTTGTGSTGDVVSIDFKRRVGENMIDGLFSQNDFVAGVWNVPGATFESVESAQLLYHIDFDRPNRDPNDCARGEFFGTGNGNDIVCSTPPLGSAFSWDGTSGILVGDQIDWYPGDALPREAGTAGGDSGSALFADQIYDRPLITGVLSGGWVNGIFSPIGGYGDVSYYNPLFLFRDWLVESNPYVYASARPGNRLWSDAGTWVQNMDPNYFYIDATGRVRNGLPSEPEPGYFADTPKWGTVFDLAVPTDVEGATGPDVPTTSLVGTQTALGVLEDPQHGTGAGYATGQASPTATNGGPTGPGSRNFVPNNSFGAYGAWDSPLDGTARFFDVTIGNSSQVELDINVEIDNLTLRGDNAELWVYAGRTLNALVAVDQFNGYVEIDGAVNTREYMLWEGEVVGNGTVTTETFFNVGGVVSANDFHEIGTLTINGDYVQTTHGSLFVDVRRRGATITNDLLQISGDASLDGTVYIEPLNSTSRPRFGDVYKVLDANTVVGNFDDVELGGVGASLFGESIVRADGSVDVVVNARRLGQIYAGHQLQSMGAAIDTLRWGGNFTNFSGLFDLVDGTGFGSFERMMFNLTPSNSFETVPLAVQHSQRMTLGLDTRASELRAGVRGLSDRSRVAGMRIVAAGENGSQGQDSPLTQGRMREVDPNSRLGFFVSGEGNLSAIGDASGVEEDRFNPQTMSAFSSADLTVGMDYRVDDGFAVGVATSMSRFLLNGDDGFIPMNHTGYGAMAYATMWNGAWHAETYAGVSHHDYDLERLPSMSAFTETQASTGATQSMLGVRAGYDFSIMDGLTFGPQIAVNYSNLRLDGYAERGDSDFALEVADRSLNSVTVETALQFAYQPGADDASPLSAYGRLALVREMGDGADTVFANFMGAPEAAFSIARELDREWISTTAGMSYNVSDRFSMNVEAMADSGRGELSNTSVQAGFNFRF